MSVPPGLSELVDGLSGAALDARVALVRDLLDSGHDVESLLAAFREDRLAMLPTTDALSNDGTLTLADVAAASDVSPDDLAAARRSLGLPVDRTGGVYGPPMQLQAQRLHDVLGAGVSLDALVRFNYVIGAGAASIAAGARDLVLDLLAEVDPNGDEHSRAVNAAELSRLMEPALIDVVGSAVGEHLRELLRHEVTSTLTGAGTRRTPDVAIVFADLVDFTALGDSVSVQQLGDVAGLLEQVTRQSLVDGCELVKTLGDGVMLAAASASVALSTALALLSGAAATTLPEVRVGVAFGPGLPRAGDWYGSVVNRASRLCAKASPGSIVADAATRSAAPSFDWTDLGPVEVRGLRDPVDCWAISPART